MQIPVARIITLRVRYPFNFQFTMQTPHCIDHDGLWCKAAFLAVATKYVHTFIHHLRKFYFSQNFMGFEDRIFMDLSQLCIHNQFMSPRIMLKCLLFNFIDLPRITQALKRYHQFAIEQTFQVSYLDTVWCTRLVNCGSEITGHLRPIQRVVWKFIRQKVLVMSLALILRARFLLVKNTSPLMQIIASRLRCWCR